jgi:hypothetical protein
MTNPQPLRQQHGQLAYECFSFFRSFTLVDLPACFLSPRLVVSQVFVFIAPRCRPLLSVQVASHPQVQFVVSKLHDWSSGFRFTPASIALQLSTGVLLLALLPTVLLTTHSAGDPCNQLTTQAFVWTINSSISPMFVDTSCGALLQTVVQCCCPSLAH